MLSKFFLGFGGYFDWVISVREDGDEKRDLFGQLNSLYTQQIRSSKDLFPLNNRNNMPSSFDTSNKNIFLPQIPMMDPHYRSLDYPSAIMKPNSPEKRTFNEKKIDGTVISGSPDKKPNYARNLRGRLGFFSETPEETLKKEQQKNEYKDYIQAQIEEKKQKKEMEKQIKKQMELIEEKKFLRQLDEINHLSQDSKTLKNLLEANTKNEKAVINNNNNNNNNSFSMKNRNNSKKSFHDENSKILEEVNEKNYIRRNVEKGMPYYDFQSKLQLEEIRNRFLLQQKNFLEEMENLKVNF